MRSSFFEAYVRFNEKNNDPEAASTNKTIDP